MPLDTIERAIKRGTGELEGVRYEAINYEGYASGGVAVIVECLTDNRNRTGADVRSLFSKNGGSMAEPGAVSWQFSRKGVISVDRAANEDELTLAALEAGAEDVNDLGDQWQVVCAPGDLAEVKAGLEESGFSCASADLVMLPNASIELTDENEARKVLKLIDALEDNDDVQNVYANFDIPDAILEAVSV